LPASLSRGASLGAVSEAIELLRSFDPRGAPRGAVAGAPDGRYVLLDVFTDNPLEGNQLAVFTDGRAIGAQEMQRLARELRLSETVFALAAEGEGDVAIRIFTPQRELPFAGHPVLGAAVLLGNALERERVCLETGIGPVEVRLRREEGRVVSGWMSQPVPSWMPYERAAELLGAVGVARSGLPVEVYDNGPRHVYVELPDAAAVSGLRPDMQALEALGEMGVSCFAGSGRHWRTRMFAPSMGVSEDPATGSAAGPLAVHLCRHGRIGFGEEIEISQGGEIERPSLLYAFAAGTPLQVERVEVGGSAVIVACGEFLTRWIG
jgi:trans-2,3-dihydro-3-hydroxyanthranilate isomerase